MAVLLNLFFDDYGLKKQHYLGIYCVCDFHN